MNWLLLTYRVATEPSRHRVGIWRELRKEGAVGLQQGTWVMPDVADLRSVAERVAVLVGQADGEVFQFELSPDPDTQARLRALFVDAREAEWAEFLSECAKFEAEIDSEISKAKLTLAELDEEEASLDRLRRWSRELRTRDIFGAPSADLATERLADCVTRLDDYAERVYRERGQA